MGTKDDDLERRFMANADLQAQIAEARAYPERKVPRQARPAAELLARAKQAVKVDPAHLHHDIDAVLDQSLAPDEPMPKDQS